MGRRGRLPACQGSRRGRIVAPAIIGAALALALAAAAPAAVAAPAAAKPASPRVIATVKIGAQPVQVAVSPRTGEAYVLNKNNTVTVINGRTSKVTATIRINPADSDQISGAIVVNQVTGDVYVINLGHDDTAGTVTVISGTTDKVIATIAVALDPDEVVVSPVNGEVYVTGGGVGTPASEGFTAVISGRTYKVITTFPVTGGLLAISPRTGLVYVLDGSGDVTVISGKTKQVVTTIPLNDPEAGDIAVSPVTGEVYVTSGGYHQGAAETVISGKTNTVIAQISTPGYGLGGLAISPKTGTVYAAWDESGSVTVVSGKTNKVTADIAFPGDDEAATRDVVVSPVTGNVYAQGGTGSVNEPGGCPGALWEISGKTSEITGQACLKEGISLAGDPISPVTGDLYAIGSPPDEVTVISG
jgi:DNA-binding beta-propeller fold protein YncE